MRRPLDCNDCRSLLTTDVEPLTDEKLLEEMPLRGVSTGMGHDGGSAPRERILPLPWLCHLQVAQVCLSASSS